MHNNNKVASKRRNSSSFLEECQTRTSFIGFCLFLPSFEPLCSVHQWKNLFRVNESAWVRLTRFKGQGFTQAFKGAEKPLRVLLVFTAPLLQNRLQMGGNVLFLPRIGASLKSRCFIVTFGILKNTFWGSSHRKALIGPLFYLKTLK